MYDILAEITSHCKGSNQESYKGSIFGKLELIMDWFRVWIMDKSTQIRFK